MLPRISAPVDEGILIARPPRSAWNKLGWLVAMVALAVTVVGYAFFHANPMH